jgi:hypothetical protein
MRKFSRRATVIAGVGAAALAGGVAFAAWTSTGSGTGSVTSTTSVNSTISPDGSGNPLYPGGSTSFTVKIDNPNSYAVSVTSISAGSSGATGSTGSCAAGSVTSDAASNPSGTIAAGGSADYTLTAHMNGNAADGCQGATFSLPLTATLASTGG